MASKITLKNLQDQEFSINHLDGAGAIAINSNNIALKDGIYNTMVGLQTIATGTATFTATTNNINLTGIGIGVEVGDVIQISGAIDAKNNSEFTVEVITDANNIIVNQAHAGKGTNKNVATRSDDTGVTVKLLAKWYNADDSLGRGWVDVFSSRSLNVQYPNNTKRPIPLIATFNGDAIQIYVFSSIINEANGLLGNVIVSTSTTIPREATYKIAGGFTTWQELR